jgi:hypothetical protein
LAAAVAWVLSLSFLNLNYFAHNAGDTIRVIGLFYLMFAPSGAVWSLTIRFRGRRATSGIHQSLSEFDAPRCYVSPWPLRLLFVQLVVIYFSSGIHKLAHPAWRSGETLHYILGDLALARWPVLQALAPLWLTRLATWLVLAWEVCFPLLVLSPRTRRLALLMGVLFHTCLGLFLELGFFPLYILCWYLPLLPWENFADSASRALTSRAGASESATDPGWGITANQNVSSETVNA